MTRNVVRLHAWSPDLPTLREIEPVAEVTIRAAGKILFEGPLSLLIPLAVDPRSAPRLLEPVPVDPETVEIQVALPGNVSLIRPVKLEFFFLYDDDTTERVSRYSMVKRGDWSP